MILTFSHVASELGILKKLGDSATPVTGAELAEISQADPVLISSSLCAVFAVQTAVRNAILTQ